MERIDPTSLMDAVALGLVAVDLEGRVLALNQRLATLIGMPAERARPWKARKTPVTRTI
jgi:sensor histidine kinase regulating citrate/malate metabolism